MLVRTDISFLAIQIGDFICAHGELDDSVYLGRVIKKNVDYVILDSHPDEPIDELFHRFELAHEADYDLGV